MTVRAQLLSARRRLKTASDGEVCLLRLPLRFEALEGRLLLLAPPEDADEETAAGAAVAAR
jgi:hypothetical protein